MTALTMEPTTGPAADLAADVTGAPARDLPPSMVERMTLLLDRFTDEQVRLTLEELARATRLPRSTAHRILDQLVRLEWLVHTPGGYGLGRRSLGLGGRAIDHTELRAAASPYLHELLMRTGAVVHLAVLDQGQVRYLDKLGGRSASAVPSRVGGLAPAYCTGLGKAMLAWLEPEVVDALLADRMTARTSSTICELEALHGELTRIRGRAGLAIERGECFQGIACVAAAVRGPHGAVGAVSVVAPQATALERVAPLLLDATRRIALDLFPDADVTSRRLRVVD